MKGPILFAKFTEDVQREVIDNRQTTSLILSKEVANIGDLTQAYHPDEHSDYAEVPPTPIALETAAAYQVYRLSSEDAAGHWMRVVILVYRLGGRILYRDNRDGTVEAVLDFGGDW